MDVRDAFNNLREMPLLPRSFDMKEELEKRKDDIQKLASQLSMVSIEEFQQLDKSIKAEVLKIAEDMKIDTAPYKTENSRVVTDKNTFHVASSEKPSAIRRTMVERNNMIPIERLELRSCRQVKSLDDLFRKGEVPPVKVLVIEKLTNLQSLQGIEYLKDTLEEVIIGGANKLQDIGALAECGNLRKVAFINCGKLEDISVLNSLEKLDEIDISGSSQINRLPEEKEGLSVFKHSQVKFSAEKVQSLFPNAVITH